jgi:copper/silver efflux system protein
MHFVSGPAMLRDEGGLVPGYVYIDVAGRDTGSYVEEAARVVRDKVALPAGNAVLWSGHYEAIERVRDRLKLVLTVTLLLVFLLLYANTRSLAKTFIGLLAVAFSAIGAIWLLYVLGYNLSVAV